MYQDLLQQAERLARLDRNKPRQANLRRAVSSTYYAMFHFLVAESCRAAIGTQHSQAAYRQVLGRAFIHATMKQACISFAGGVLKSSVAKGLPPGFGIDPEIRRVARAFCTLQEQRHSADYDLTVRFDRADVLGIIQLAGAAIEDFNSLAASDAKKFFLACLWAWSGLATR